MSRVLSGGGAVHFCDDLPAFLQLAESGEFVDLAVVDGVTERPVVRWQGQHIGRNSPESTRGVIKALTHTCAPHRQSRMLDAARHPSARVLQTSHFRFRAGCGR